MSRRVKNVYLAGPITGLSYTEAREGWRVGFAELLPEHIEASSPLRGKEFLAGEDDLDGTPQMYTFNAMSTKKGICTRDRNDVRNCDAMVVNFIGAERVSIGTCVEFGWASADGKPIIMIIEEDPSKNPHNHAMLDHLSGYVCNTLEQAAHLLTHLLTPAV